MAIHSSTSAQLWNYSGKLILSVRMLLNTSSYRSCNLTVFELCHCILCRLVFDRCESRCRVQGKPGSRLVVAENNVSLIPLPSQLDVYHTQKSLQFKYLACGQNRQHSLNSVPALSLFPLETTRFLKVPGVHLAITVTRKNIYFQLN